MRREGNGGWSSGNIEEFLGFEPTEVPQWRKETTNKDAPSVSQMLKDIVNYKKLFQQLKQTSSEDDRKKIFEDLLVRFLCTIQKEEDIGVQEESLTKSLMKDVDDETASCMSTDAESENRSITIDYVRNNSPELPSIELDKTVDLADKVKERGATPTQSKTETINLYKAYKHIKNELEESMNEKAKGDCTGFYSDLFTTKNDNKGFIEVESLIKYTHKILMTGVIFMGTPPGHLSTLPRDTYFNGKLHTYPEFKNEVVAELAVQTLVDKINEIIESIKQRQGSEEEKAKLYFKCSSLFLFSFLTLHPFGDGNGRLARLLASYNLLTYSPFLTPIYNVYSPSRKCDYIQALVDARKRLPEPKPITARDEAINLTISIMHQKPSDLCSLLIESNWTVWRQILVKLGVTEIQLYPWEVEKQTF